MYKNKLFKISDIENPFDFLQPKEQKGFPLLYRVTNRLILFLFLQSWALCIFYLVGNWQGFLDLTLQVILLLHSLCAICLFFASLWAILQYVLFMKLNRFKIRATYIAVYTFLCLYSIVATFFSQLINFISQGI